MTLDTATAKTVANTANTAYNIFLCKHNNGTIFIGTDTDVNGANITNLDGLRWIGFVYNGPTNIMEDFLFDGEIIWFTGTNGIPVATLTSSYAQVDFSSFFPLTRVSSFQFGSYNSTRIISSRNGTTDHEAIFTAAGSYKGNYDGSYPWAKAPASGAHERVAGTPCDR